MAKAVKKVVKRRRERKVIEKGAVHIRSSFNNTMVTVTDMQGELPPTDTIKRVMSGLQTCVVENLRRGDAVALYSATQLVVMLGQTTRENGCLVLDRLLQTYKQQYPMESVHVQYRLEAVDPLN